MRACIIGAGAAGLCSARHIASLSHWEPTVFELSNRVGGVWVYDEAKHEENGHGWRSSMYRNLRSNLPKEVMAFPDFPFPSSLPSFIGHQDVQQYLQSYAEHFGLFKYIKFNHEVTFVDQPVSNGQPWRVTVKNLSTKEVFTENFDAIFVCNGHYSRPNMPSLPNATEFRGLQMHSTEYKAPEKFTNMRVACFGAGPSGIDIALDLCPYADKVYLCHKNPRITSQLPANMVQLPPIVQLTPNGFLVGQGPEAEEILVDVIIYCTGYQFSFPFINSDCGITLDGWRVSPLYQHMVNIHNPFMFFIGICFIIIPFPFFHTQIEYATAVLTGKATIPTEEEMLNWEMKDYEHRRKVMLLPHKKAHLMSSMQWDYLEELAKLGKFKCRVPPVIAKMFEYTHQCRKTLGMGYRSVNFTVINDEQFDVTGL